MGNAAVSSKESMSTPGLVRLLVANGKVLHFEYPVLAIQVMQDHPGHLVLKCGPSSMWNERIREESYASLTYEALKEMGLKDKVDILRADQELDQRSTYYLLPIKATKKQVRFRWNMLFKAVKNSGRVGSSFEFEPTSDFSSGEKHFCMLRRSRSLPRSVSMLVEENEEQPNLCPTVSSPSRSSTRGQSLSNHFVEGIGRSQELQRLRLQHKRPRRIRRPSQVGWRPILESISEVVDEFSDDEDYSGDFYKSQSKCLRRFQSFQSPSGNFTPVTV